MSDFSLISLVIGVSFLVSFLITTYVSNQSRTNVGVTNKRKRKPKIKDDDYNRLASKYLHIPTRFEYKTVSKPFPEKPLYETDAWNYMTEDAKREYVANMFKATTRIMPIDDKFDPANIAQDSFKDMTQ